MTQIINLLFLALDIQGGDPASAASRAGKRADHGAAPARDLSDSGLKRTSGPVEWADESITRLSLESPESDFNLTFILDKTTIWLPCGSLGTSISRRDAPRWAPIGTLWHLR